MIGGIKCCGSCWDFPCTCALAMADPGDGNGRWVWIPDDDRPDPPHDDHKDHSPCPECNAHGKGKTPGWYHPLTGPAEHCKWCEGAGWL